MKPRGIVLRYEGSVNVKSDTNECNQHTNPIAMLKPHRTEISNQNSKSNSNDDVLEPTTTADAEHMNLMPSMVVRQQRNQIVNNNNNNNNNNLDEHDARMIYSKVNSSSFGKGVAHQSTIEHLFEETKKNANKGQQSHNQPMFDKDGLILPRSILPSLKRDSVHPQLGQKPTAIRDLNRELKFNQARGKNVLDQKSELKKALEKLEANRRRKEAEQERLSRRTSLELRLEKRAQTLGLSEDTPSGDIPTSD